MEPSINATNNWFETFWAWLTHYFEAPSREGPLLTDSKNHAPILLCSTLSSSQAGANQNIHQKLWRRVERSEFIGSSSGSGLASTICVHAVEWCSYLPLLPAWNRRLYCSLLGWDFGPGWTQKSSTSQGRKYHLRHYIEICVGFQVLKKTKQKSLNIINFIP